MGCGDIVCCVFALLDRAERSTQAAWASLCIVLASADGDQLQPFAERVRDLASKTFGAGKAQRHMDNTLAVACAMLVRKVSPPQSVEAHMAYAVCCLARFCA